MVPTTVYLLPLESSTPHDATVDLKDTIGEGENSTILHNLNQDAFHKDNAMASTLQESLKLPPLGNKTKRVMNLSNRAVSNYKPPVRASELQVHSFRGSVPLSREAVDGVEKFVFFVGYGRSGSSIIGSILDAHPNVIIAHEYRLPWKWAEHPEKYNLKKTFLFNELYRTSVESLTFGWRSPFQLKKGYSLYVEGTWQGRFTELKVIGDKSTGNLPDRFRSSPANATREFHQLLETVKIPIRVIHLVRNPYDIIATVALYRASPIVEVKLKATPNNRYNNSIQLTKLYMFIFGRAEALLQMIPLFNLTVLEVHIEDFIQDPRNTLQRLCDFIEVECLEDYLQLCLKNAFSSVSRTRDLVVWPPELRAAIDREKQKYPFFRGYSFESDYWWQ